MLLFLQVISVFLMFFFLPQFIRKGNENYPFGKIGIIAFLFLASQVFVTLQASKEFYRNGQMDALNGQIYYQEDSTEKLDEPRKCVIEFPQEDQQKEALKANIQNGPLEIQHEGKVIGEVRPEVSFDKDGSMRIDFKFDPKDK